MDYTRILNALWKVRKGNPYEYQEAIDYGICLGMAAMLPFEQHCIVGDLALNAAKHARLDKAKGDQQ